MDSEFRKRQRAYYLDTNLDTARQYITVLERLCGLGPFHELRPNNSKLSALLKRKSNNEEELAALRREQLLIRFAELELVLLQHLHEHRPSDARQDFLDIESEHRYRFLGGDPPYRYRIVRNLHRKYVDPDDKKYINTLLSVGAIQGEQRNSSGYNYSSYTKDKETLLFDRVPSLTYFALSRLPNGQTASITIDHLDKDIDFLVGLLENLIED